MDKLASAWRFLFALVAVGTSGWAAAQNVPPTTTAPPVASQPPGEATVPPPAPATVPPPAPPPPQTVVEPLALPAIPSAPSATLAEYPNCRDEHGAIAGRVAKATKVRSCIVRLDQYNRDILQVVARRMEAHRNALAALWDEVNNGAYSHPQKREFYARVSVEFANSQADGSYMDQFRLTHGRYIADRDYLSTEYCNLVTCS